MSDADVETTVSEIASVSYWINNTPFDDADPALDRT